MLGIQAGALLHPSGACRGPGDTRREEKGGSTQVPRQAFKAACYSQERPNWIASASANSRSFLGQGRSSRAGQQLYRALWKAVSVGASWSGRGFRWDVSTAVRTISLHTVSSPKGQFWLLPEGGAVRKPGRASGVRRAGPGCPELHENLPLKNQLERDGSVVKRAYCSCRELGSQHPHHIAVLTITCPHGDTQTHT